MSTLNHTVYKNADGTINITFMHIAGIAVGALALYLMVPARKRKTLFK